MRDPSHNPNRFAHRRESVAALESLMSYTQTYSLWRQLLPGCVAYLWTHGSGDRASRIDMVWAPTAIADLIEECEYHPSFLADHQYLLVKFHPLPKIDSVPRVWKFNTSLLRDPEYVSLVSSFWSHWQSLEDHEDFSSPMDWWDQGKFYLREVTRSYSRSKDADQSSRKTSLTCQMHQLKRLFDQGDRSAVGKLCEVQQDLRGIALHEGHRCALVVNGSKKERLRLPSS